VGRDVRLGAAPVSAPEGLRAILTCPVCLDSDLHGFGDPASGELRCSRCAAVYPVVDGIPVLVAAAGEDAFKVRQAAFFDAEQDDEYEITRPHGTPAFHRYLLEEKFRRSVSALRPLLPGSSALTVCGGSGMDAEFLARAGASVVSSDISLGAARRARERARRFGLALTPIVADAERLPVRDRAVDLGYVHDGLHHLERPRRALGELARSSRRAVSVTEPAQAALTALAVRVGLAQDREEAGNRVERLRPEAIERELREAGFEIAASSRYAMLYRHEAGPVARSLSGPLMPLGKAALEGLNRLASGLGNKLTVQAVRPEAGP